MKKIKTEKGVDTTSFGVPTKHIWIFFSDRILRRVSKLMIWAQSLIIRVWLADFRRASICLTDSAIRSASIWKPLSGIPPVTFGPPGYAPPGSQYTGQYPATQSIPVMMPPPAPSTRITKATTARSRAQERFFKKSNSHTRENDVKSVKE